MKIQNPQELKQKFYEYARDELMTVDNILSPSHQQIIAKAREIIAWPMFQNFLKDLNYSQWFSSEEEVKC